jgi:N-acetylmuramoyl-L-alanine amidase
VTGRLRERGATAGPVRHAMAGRYGRCRAYGVGLLLTLGGCVAGPRIDDNYRAASQDSRVQFIVIHYTELDFAASLKRLTEGNVSSHYLVDRDPPRIYRLVPEQRRAWHAGRSYWQGYTHLNASSIGIEIVNAGNGGDPAAPYAPYPPGQIDQVVELVRDIQQRHAVAPHRIVGHSDIQPLSKQDPGPSFPWGRLADAGLIPWPDAVAVAARRAQFTEQLPSVAWFQQKLAMHGYEVPQDGALDEATRNVLAAFQMKYRPSRYDGEPDADTAALLEVVTSAAGLLIRGPDGRLRPYRPE